ncbi:hypothetical protein FWK35_00014756 [Aphis craccivora]|uniref:Uncharacterized protein n=1 Tax=Aphis craccivora TaxID=307492 RepID=A0A6G0YM23_APHCR|nr:hypothetical protein FWK35_00014756 [Aphis craccivora]
MSIFELKMLIKKLYLCILIILIITIGRTYEELCIKFLSIFIGPKIFFRKIENFSCL